MGGSLFDQLKQTGLVDKNKAKQASKKKHIQNRNRKSKQTTQSDESTLRAQQVQSEKAARDRELNRQLKQAAEKKAVAAQIRQLIEMNRVEDNDGEIAYHFVDDNNVRQIYVSEKVQGKLVRGQLAIVSNRDSYNLVSVRVAEMIAQRDPSSVILCNAARAEDADDDAYADYQVPDDLMW